MSARQRFVAGSVAPASGGGGGTDKSTAIDLSQAADISSPFVGNPNALRDKSNSPRPTAKNPKGSPLNRNKSGSQHKDLNAPCARDNMQISKNKPLNLTSLTGAKAKKGSGDEGGVSAQNKKPRMPVVDRLKENRPRPSLVMQSPRAHPQSPTRGFDAMKDTSAAGTPRRIRAQEMNNSRARHSLYSTFGSSGAPLLAEESGSAAYEQEDPSLSFNRAHILSLNPALDTSFTDSAPASFTASGQALMSPYPTSDSRSAQNRALKPAQREVFPLGSTRALDAMHIRPSISPGRTMEDIQDTDIIEYQAPLHSDGYDENLSPDNDRSLRRATKRISQHEVDDVDSGRGRDEKRMKFDPRIRNKVNTGHRNNGMEDPIRNRQATPMQQTRYSTPAHGDYNAANAFDDQVYQTSAHYLQQQPGAAHASSQPISEELQGISRLFGIDAEQYLLEHIEQYEASRKRWMNCSIEEWKKGADEMTAKFGEIVDFVKDHLSNKLSLFASLHDKVAEHKNVLNERDASLKAIREKLVKDSGNVLGGAANAAPE